MTGRGHERIASDHGVGAIYLCVARGSVLRGRVVGRENGWPWTPRSALVDCEGRLYVVMRRTLRRIRG